MNYLSAFTCVKDEKRCYLEEWVAYHYYLGVDHFTFYNGGQPIAPLPHSTIIEWPGVAQQLACFRDYCQHPNARWSAMFDVDEFMVPHAWPSLPEMLTHYETFGGLCINWLDFGSNGQPDDDRPQVVKFTRRSAQSFHLNKHVKTIAQIDKTVDVIQSHSFAYKPGYFAVNPDYQLVAGPYSPNVIDKVQLNHYYFRSKPEWDRKVWTQGPCGGHRKYDEWVHEPECNAVEDLAALNIWKEATAV